MEKIYELEEAKTKLYNIYKDYLLKDINSEQAVESILNYMDSFDNYYEVNLTKHMNTLLVRLVVKLLLKINPKHPLFYKFLEGGILDNSILINTRFYLFNIVKIHFPDNLDNLSDFIIRYLPQYFPENITYDAVELIKAGFSQFLFQTYKTLSSYLNQPFKWNRNFSGFSNGEILIVKKANNPYNEEDYAIQYSYNNNNERIIGDGIKLLQLGFILQIYKLIEKNFNTTGLFFNFPSAPDIPIKISYEKDCNILLFIFKDPLDSVPQRPAHIYKNKRSAVIDYNPRKSYIK